MPRELPDADFDHAIELYRSGKTIKESAAAIGVGASTLRIVLSRRGIEPRRPAGRPRQIPLSEKEIATAYEAGASGLQLSRTHGVSRSVIRRCLAEAGVAIRGRTEAGLVRAAQMTPEQRAAQAAAAHDASRGRTVPMVEQCKSAKGRERIPGPMSVHEQRFASWLTELHVPYRREVAIGPYNVDFAIGSVAVEILGGEWHGYKTIHARRTPYILNQGWAMAFVWATANCPMTREVADQVVTYANQIGREPALIGEYWVLRGDGQLIATGGTESDEIAFIPAARHGFD